MKEYGVSGSDRKVQLFHLTDALAKRWKGRPVVILVDEIYAPSTLKCLADHAERIPQSIRLILAVNPALSSCLPTTLPESFLRINLATPYRSPIAITAFTRFIEKCEPGMAVSDGEFGSDVEGKKPIVFDVGKDEVKLREALQRSRDLFGNNATLLYDLVSCAMKDICKSYGKEEEGPAWDCYHAAAFFGWEAERLVAVTGGGFGTLEMATRAKIQLILILTEPEREDLKKYYADYQKRFKVAAEKGLVELFVSENAN